MNHQILHCKIHQPNTVNQLPTPPRSIDIYNRLTLDSKEYPTDILADTS